jgi:hypothetical protein
MTAGAFMIVLIAGVVWLLLSRFSLPSTFCLHVGGLAHPLLGIFAVLTRSLRRQCRTFERTLKEANEGSRLAASR